MNVERLTKLAELLETATGREVRIGDQIINFDIGFFVGEGTCGTAACAAGMAGLHPWFRKQGFRTNRRTGSVQYKNHHSYGACEAFFGVLAPFRPISYRNGNPNPTTVARRIRAAISAALAQP